MLKSYVALSTLTLSARDAAGGHKGSTIGAGIQDRGNRVLQYLRILVDEGTSAVVDPHMSLIHLVDGHRNKQADECNDGCGNELNHDDDERPAPRISCFFCSAKTR